MPSQSKRLIFNNCVLEVCAEVYEPAEDSFLFAENLPKQKTACVLDMGTGCGILGIITAKRAHYVLAVDINPHAIRCAKQNANINKVSGKMAFIQGDLFSALKPNKKFDLILFNAPYLPSEETENTFWLGRAWAGGTTGRQVIDQFILQAPHYLKRNGKILLMQSSLSNVEETCRLFSAQSLSTNIVAVQSFPFFETLVLIEAQAST
ncbi:MAG: class I SAM-dependent methyltransferase [Candidatus Bathyarchaeota archaeon]|nr:class I SAM-dependent methyltransferase [Candidatus Bathyarchaeota archaeon]